MVTGEKKKLVALRVFPVPPANNVLMTSAEHLLRCDQPDKKQEVVFGCLSDFVRFQIKVLQPRSTINSALVMVKVVPLGATAKMRIKRRMLAGMLVCVEKAKPSPPV
jgi:hypothetical protein